MGINDRHSKILEARGLDAELLAMLGVSSSDRRDGDFIQIPYIENGVRVNAKYRTIVGEKRFHQEAGARKVFWNIDILRDETLADLPVIITEGEFDAIAAIQCGFPRTVSVPDGAPAKELGENDTGTKYSFINEALHLLRDVREIILAVDNDGPGTNLLHDLALRLGKARCKWVRYPQGCKDLNDALVKFGRRGVEETIRRAQWVKVEGIYRMSELPPARPADAYDTGMVNLCDHYKLRLGDLCIVTGIPSHGKSTFINEVCCRMAIKHGWSTAFASFEQRPQIDHRRSLRRFHGGRRVKDMTVQEIDAADAWIDQHFSFIVPSEDDDVTLEWTLERCAAAIVQHGVKIVVIDPWNEMDHVRPPDMSLTEYTGFAIKQFRKLANKYQVHVIVAAHPTKIRREADGKTPVPTLYDISDSAHWFNKADVGIVIHRLDETMTLIRIAKSRYHEVIGKPGDLKASFNPEIGKYFIHDDLRGVA